MFYISYVSFKIIICPFGKQTLLKLPSVLQISIKHIIIIKKRELVSYFKSILGYYVFILVKYVCFLIPLFFSVVLENNTQTIT